MCLDTSFVWPGAETFFCDTSHAASTSGTLEIMFPVSAETVMTAGPLLDKEISDTVKTHLEAL